MSTANATGQVCYGYFCCTRLNTVTGTVAGQKLFVGWRHLRFQGHGTIGMNVMSANCGNDVPFSAAGQGDMTHCHGWHGFSTRSAGHAHPPGLPGCQLRVYVFVHARS
ncbi:hypothetical protein Mapa_005419 [Marchantia paleacea]|nr:hypothetical protein Mapa_005419 [Marchantia paleacea]